MPAESPRLKKVLNLHEEATHLRLRDVCKQYDASVYPKVRLADVLSIEGSGISDEDYRFALQSHFDFLVTNTQHDPLFAVEFDGGAHKAEAQKRRDSRKDRLCEKFELPFLRINSNYLQKKYRGMDVLSWIVGVWFLRKSFDEAQEIGFIPDDEPFGLASFTVVPGHEKQSPFYLSLESRLKIAKLFRAGACQDPIPSYFVGIDKQGTYHAIAFLRLTDQSGVYAETAMRHQQFPFIVSEILGEVVVCELCETLTEVLKKKSDIWPLSEIDAKVLAFRQHYEFRVASYCGTPADYPIS